jgi:hypothetical protein
MTPSTVRKGNLDVNIFVPRIGWTHMPHALSTLNRNDDNTRRSIVATMNARVVKIPSHGAELAEKKT